MGEVVPARTSPTLHCPCASIVVTSTVRVKTLLGLCCSRYLLRKHIQTTHMTVSAHPDQIITALRMGGDEGVTVYMCEECNAVFLSQDDLAVHILAEHMKQGFNAGETAPSQVRDSNISADYLKR